MKNIILDIDSVGDDMLAIFYAAKNKDLNILGITTVNGACGSIEQANNIALNMVELTDENIPVFMGAENMLKPSLNKVNGDPVNFDQELRWKFGDRLNKFNEVMPESKRKIETMSAEDFMIAKANQYGKDLVIVTTGPVTNLAKALQKDSSLADKIEEVYMLGGRFASPGNITPVTEYNIWADPEAAQMVFRSNCKITLVPLDVCENNEFADGMMTRDHLADLEYGNPGKISRFMIEKFPIYIDLWREFFQLAGFPMDDVITVALVANPELCEYSQRVFVDVELGGQISRGMTIPYFGHQIIKNSRKEHKNVRIARKLYGKKFMNRFIQVIKNN